MVKVKPAKFRLHLFLAVAIAVVSSVSTAAQANQSEITADGAAPLAGTQWKLVDLDGKFVPRGEFQPYFTLRVRERLASGSAGELVNVKDRCGNHLTGFYETKNDWLRFHVVTSTLLACLIGPVPSTQENDAPPYQPISFPEVLSATSRFRIEGSTLRLLNQRGVVLARFVAASEQN
jgi:heat shock protein HslJ